MVRQHLCRRVQGDIETHVWPLFPPISHRKTDVLVITTHDSRLCFDECFIVVAEVFCYVAANRNSFEFFSVQQRSRCLWKGFFFTIGAKSRNPQFFPGRSRNSVFCFQKLNGQLHRTSSNLISPAGASGCLTLGSVAQWLLIGASFPSWPIWPR